MGKHEATIGHYFSSRASTIPCNGKSTAMGFGFYINYNCSSNCYLSKDFSDLPPHYAVKVKI